MFDPSNGFEDENVLLQVRREARQAEDLRKPRPRQPEPPDCL
jgi:hypothetical protein